MDRLRQKDIIAILTRHRVSMAYLFGSRARARQVEGSDVDLAVQLDDSQSPVERLEEAAAMSSELSKALGLPVDVVVLNDANPLVAFEAVIRGVTILAPDPDRAFRFEQRVRWRFEDFGHIQRFFVDEHRRRLGL